ncbi:MAG: hypothetical protein JNG85_08485 [Spirochaetaceae bacterium]|nr:hypothetical protein [Spirochaetaceae bacterium]
MLLQPLPAIARRSEERLDYGTRRFLRLALGGLCLAALVVAENYVFGIARALWFLGAGILGFAALSEDRWSFLAAGAAGGTALVRRRFGLFPLSRTWELPVERISALELRAGAEGESSFLVEDERRGMEASLLGMGKGSWVALVLVLDDGRSLALAAGKPGRALRLRKEGAALAAHLKLPFVDACESDGGCADPAGE